MRNCYRRETPKNLVDRNQIETKNSKTVLSAQLEACGIGVFDNHNSSYDRLPVNSNHLGNNYKFFASRPTRDSGQIELQQFLQNLNSELRSSEQKLAIPGAKKDQRSIKSQIQNRIGLKKSAFRGNCSSIVSNFLHNSSVPKA